MSNSHAQDVHANNAPEAIGAYLHKYDIEDSLNGTVDQSATFVNAGGHPDGRNPWNAGADCHAE